MILRLVGLFILVGAVMGTVVAVLGLRTAPEKIRDLTLASLFTLAGAVMLGFGLAFSSGVSRIVLVVAGLISYLCGLVSGLSKRGAGTAR